MSLIYLDTARLGQACPQAFQAQLDFNRLAAEDPSMYCEQFFRDGTLGWHEEKLSRFAALAKWRGLRNFKSKIIEQFGNDSPDAVFLANRSIQLVRLAARLMFRKCRNVLTTDLNWPSWQRVVQEEAIRLGQRTTNTNISQLVFSDRATATDINSQILRTFCDHDCDGVFLPAVSNLGVHLNTHDMLARLKGTGQLRFSLVDAAQSFCHIINPTPLPLADCTIAGCHKWMRGSLPLGLGICGRSIVAEQLREMMRSASSMYGIDDPLLRFSEQLEHRVVDRYSETVNVAPLFSANAAVTAPHTDFDAITQRANHRTATAELLQDSIPKANWSLVETDTSLDSNVFLIQSKSHNVILSEPESIRSRFRDLGVAISAYPKGLIRMSAAKPIGSSDADAIRNALMKVA